MPRILVVLHDAFNQTNRYLGLMLVTNGGAAALSLPVAVLGLVLLPAFHPGPFLPVALVAVVVIFPSPALAGAQFVAHETANRNPVFWRDQIDGLRRYWWPALKCWAFSIAFALLLAGNAAFYFQHHFPLSGAIALLFVLLFTWWALCHLYVYPLIVEQEQKRLILIYRNAILIAVARPAFTVIVGLIWLAAVFALSLTALIAIFGLILCAQIQQNAAAVILPTLQPKDAQS
jgi:uncharacterized membrane protein YesL